MTRILASIGFLFIAATPFFADELTTLAGKDAIKGTLEKITPGEIVITGKSTPLAQALLLTLRPNRTVPEAEKYIEVSLADDSVQRCTKVVFGVKDTELTLTTGVTMKAPTAAILTVLRDAQDTKLKEQWPKLMKSKKRTDRIFILRDGDLNPIDGSLGAIDEAKQSIKFKPDAAAEIEPSFDKLQGFQFSRTEVPADKNLCKVFDIDGNILIASKLTYDAGQLAVTTPYGHKVALPNKSVAKLDFNFGRLTYLSDLDEKMSASAFLGGFNPLRKNTSLDGNPILVQDKQYAKGLSCYAGADFEYKLGSQYKKFAALLSVDLRIAEEGQGQVTVSIIADGTKLFSQEVSTKAPIPVNLDVRDVNSLRIVIAGPNFLPYHGHAVLANAHVSQ